MTRKFLIVTTNAIGDTLLSASSIPHLFNNYPQVEIHFVINKKALLLKDILNSKKMFIVSKKSLKELISLVMAIRKNNYDCAMNFFPGIFNSLILLFSQSKKKAGYINLIYKKDWHLNTQKIFTNFKSDLTFWIPQSNFLERVNLVLHKVINSNTYVEKYRYVYKKIHIVSEPYLLIHFYSRDSDKSLSTEQLEFLINSILKKKQIKIILIGSSSDHYSAISEIKIKFNLIIKNNCSIDELTSLINDAHFFFAIDSFPLHIADTFNTNFIGFFATTNPLSVLVNYEKSIKFSNKSLKLVSKGQFSKKITPIIENIF